MNNKLPRLIKKSKLQVLKINNDDANRYITSITKDLIKRQTAGYKTLDWKTFELNDKNEVISRIPANLIDIIVGKMRELSYDISVIQIKTIADSEETVIRISWEHYLPESDPIEDPMPPEVKDKIEPVVLHLIENIQPPVKIFSASGGKAPSWEGFISFEDEEFYNFCIVHNLRIERRADGWCTFAQSVASKFLTSRQAEKVLDKYMQTIVTFKRREV